MEWGPVRPHEAAAHGMIFTRLGYSLIILVILVAAGAISFVLRPSTESHVLDAQAVVNYSRYRVVESISENGRTITVRFKKDFDTNSAFGTSSHVFTSTLPQGASIVTMLQAAGVPVNGTDGIRVTVQ
ncbi:MAG: hypothetical protein ACYC9X_03710 [Dehalococcoidia bacterium]